MRPVRRSHDIPPQRHALHHALQHAIPRAWRDSSIHFRPHIHTIVYRAELPVEAVVVRPIVDGVSRIRVHGDITAA